jgi:Rrf2 family protein
MLSNSCQYGIRAMVYIASQPPGNGMTGIRKISTDLKLPTPYLAKILQQLVRQKILNSAKGPHGGFSLQKDPRKISLLDIVVSIDGDGIFTNCVMHSGSCITSDKMKKPCPLHADYEIIRKDLIGLFSSRSIHDLVLKANSTDLITI